MQEVMIRLSFTQPCLGDIKQRQLDGSVKYCFLRDASGRVMLLASLWRSLFTYAATVLNRDQRVVRAIDWSPYIDCGPTGTWRRIVVSASEDKRGRARYAVHEAFLPESMIGVNAVLPAGISLETLGELLDVVGVYRGISPFRGGETYGAFDVVSVNRTIR